MLFYPSAPAAARDVVLRVRQSSRPVARRPRGSARSQSEAGREGPVVSRPATSLPNPPRAASHQRSRARRALRRRLAQASARIERSGEYQRSLAQLAELAAGFQQGLDAAQRGRWLTLEETVLEHTARLNRAYFHAGVEAGALDARLAHPLNHERVLNPERAGAQRPAAAAAPVKAHPLDAAIDAAAAFSIAADAIAADARLIAALAELVAQLRRLNR